MERRGTPRRPVERLRAGHPLAEVVFSRAARLGVDDRLARRLADQVAPARLARHRRHAEAIQAALARAAAGQLSGEAHREAVVELAGYAERQTVDLLLAPIREAALILRLAARKRVLSVIEMTGDEAAAWARIEGLEGAVDAWLAAAAPASPPPGRRAPATYRDLGGGRGRGAAATGALRLVPLGSRPQVQAALEEARKSR